MRIAVTGATGNIGTALLQALEGRPGVDEVIGIERRRPDRHDGKTRWVAADIAVDDLVAAFAGVDAVIHLAWLIQPSHDEATMWRTNVQGSIRVFEAAVAAGVGALVHVSSVGAYSPAPKDRPLDESWPTHGILTSAYSRHKAYVERLLDTLEAEEPAMRIVRVRPALVLQRETASHIRRLFLGPFLPASVMRRAMFPVIPRFDRLRFQVVHADDVAAALVAAATTDHARGAFNLAAEPVLDADVLGRMLGARPVPVPAALLRGAADLGWRLRLLPADPGWVDMVLSIPVMDTTRARDVLGWVPRRGAEDAFEEILAGLGDSAGADTPPLRPYEAAADGAGAIVTRMGGSDPVERDR